tara:strand:- start:3038 stop:3709 length:672 start_codon:yes stop_codon:yes gene_type:complete
MPDIFERNAIAYEDAKNSLAALTNQTIADDFKVLATQHLIKTDPVAALYDALDAADQARHEDGPGFIDHLSTFCKLATKVTLPDDTDERTRFLRFLIETASDLYYNARVIGDRNLISESKITATLERLADGIWPGELLYGHRLQDYSDFKIACHASKANEDGLFLICGTYEGDRGSMDAGSLITPRQTATEAQRLANAINRCLKNTPQRAASIISKTQTSEAA